MPDNSKRVAVAAVPTKEVGIHFDVPKHLYGDEAIEWMRAALADCNFVQMQMLPASPTSIFKENVFYMGNFLG
jgi:hypothetical protein